VAAWAIKLPLAPRRALLHATTAEEKDMSPVTVLLKPRPSPVINVGRKVTFPGTAPIPTLVAVAVVVGVNLIIVAQSATAVVKSVTLLVTAPAPRIVAAVVVMVVDVAVAVAAVEVVDMEVEVVEATVPSEGETKRLASPVVV